MKNIFFVAAICAVLFGIIYFSSNPAIVNPGDYAKYLSKTPIETSQKNLATQINFWENKLQADPANFIYQKKLAGLYAADFKMSGHIQQLHRSDSLLRIVNEQIPNQVGVLLSLASNAITRHAFQEAETYTMQAYRTGEKKFVSSLVRTDVHLERGDFASAAHLLDAVASDKHFDYLIRKVKLLDQQGDLGAAIETMEQATSLAKDSGSKSLLNWSLSNLADMYGHDGSISKSYKTYLAALACNPADFHALKGIAWIAFSHDKNCTEAKRILNFLRSEQAIPDYDLMLSEIAAFEKNTAVAAAYQHDFLLKANDPAYGNMYKSYTCKIKNATQEGVAEALEIAKAEVLERPHPVSYALLAWSTYRNGDDAHALEILQNNVLHQTEEPIALYISGSILKGTGHDAAAKKYFAQALEAGFELGPVLVAEIEEDIATL